MIHQKKNRGHQTPKIVKIQAVIANAICPIIVDFIF